MNHTPDTAAADNGGTLDPTRAAAMLDEATRQARRKLEPAPPWLLATRGILVLAVLGAVWLSVRGQHPYRGPTEALVPVAVGFGVLNYVATLAVRGRATAGVRGRTRLSPAEIAILTLVWVAAFAVIGVLAGTGVSDSIAYGVYPATAPLIVGGLAWAIVAAAHAQWRPFGTGVAVAIVGAVGIFAGPVGAWAVAGVGLCAVLLGNAAVVAWRQRA